MGSVLFAQGGSNYTLFGIGDIRTSLGAAYDGMAATQIAVPSDHAINLRNPAMWGSVRTTRVQAGFRFNQVSVASESASAAQNNGKLDGFTALFCVDTGLRATISVGLLPYSTVNYTLKRTIVANDPGATNLGTSTQTGSGGITTFHIGGSIRPTDDLTVGLALVGLFGNLSSVNTTLFATSDNLETISQRIDDFGGNGLRFGLHYEPTERLSLGFSSTVFAQPEVFSRRRSLARNVVNGAFNSDFADSSLFRTAMPLELGFGAAFRTGKYLLASDLVYRSFSGFNYRQGGASFRDNIRASVGMTRLGASGAGFGFWDRTALSLGAFYEQQYYSVLGTPIDEMGLSGGLQVPISGTMMLDLAVNGGMRGVKGRETVQEVFARTSIAISIGETWFKPFVRD